MFGAVADVIAQTGILRGRRKRCVDSTVFDDAVATMDTVSQLTAAIRKVARVVDGAAQVIAAVCKLDDFTIDEDRGTVTCPAGQVRQMSASRTVSFGAAAINLRTLLRHGLARCGGAWSWPERPGTRPPGPASSPGRFPQALKSRPSLPRTGGLGKHERVPGALPDQAAGRPSANTGCSGGS